MKTIIHDVLPCWYELSWVPKKIAILIRIHQDVLGQFDRVRTDSPIVQEFLETFHFKEFSEKLEKGFGFDHALQYQGHCDGFVELLAKAPVVKQKIGKRCPECKGSKRDPVIGGKCLRCGGTGERYDYVWHDAFATSASFSILFSLLAWMEIETSASFPQLLIVETITHNDMHGGSLGGMYSIPLTSWLASKGAELPERHVYVIGEMIEAMKATYYHMLGKGVLDDHYFEAYIADNKGWLNVSCPGNACGLHPSYSRSPDEGSGYAFSCHNVDSPAQQFTLLAGLAALHDRVR